jgi:putative addiction module killer protein
VIIDKTETFNKWLLKLKNNEAVNRILKRLTRIKIDNNLGDYKALGGGLFEIRIDYGVGYRIYFKYEGDKIILLLIGGDKSTQQDDIKKARSFL